jgi:hypothetical protein
MYNPAQVAGTYRSTGERLMWSEYLYLISIAAAAVILVDPLELELDNATATKHLMLLLTFPAFILTLVGRRLSQFQAPPILSRVVAEAWPFLVLALIIIGGSMYARLVNGVQQTLLNFGLYMLMIFVSASMLLASKAPEKLIRAYFKILMVAALAMSVSLILHYKAKQVYHVEIFVVIPMAVYCALALKNPFLRIGGTMFFLSMALFSGKNTGYLIALMTFLYLGYGFWLPRLRQANPLKRFSGYYVIFVILLLICAGVMFLLAFREAYLPSGSTEVRMWAYQRAWNLFLDSPIWGTFFSERAVEKFPGYEIAAAGGILPTHSDVMDLLAHGGVLAITLWLCGLFVIARAGNRTLLTPSTYEHPWTPYAHTLAVLSLAGIIAYAVNPVMVATGMAYMLWTNLGLLLGLSLRPEAVPAPKVTSKRPLGRYEFKRYTGETS